LPDRVVPRCREGCMVRRSWRPRGLLIVFIAVAWPAHVVAPARGDSSDLEEIKLQMQQLMRQNAEQQRLIEKLQEKLEGIESRDAATGPPAEAAVERDRAESQPTVDVDPAAALDAALGALDDGDTPARSDAAVALERAMEALESSPDEQQRVDSQRRLGG